MNSVWQQSPEERLKLWRKFRKDNENLEDQECLQAIVDWWKFTPIGSRAIDPYSKDTWPDPWQLIYEGNFDENAVALGIAYTLHLMEWPCTVSLVQSEDKTFFGLIVIVDDEYVLNYTYGEIDKFSEMQQISVLEKYTTDELT